MFSFLFSGFKSILAYLKKALLVFVVFFVVTSIFLYFINKDKVANNSFADPIKKNRNEIYKIVNDPKLNKTKEGKLTILVYKGMMCSAIGEACTNNQDDGDKNLDKSLFGKMTELIVIPFANPPASGVAWVYDGLQNAGFVPKSLAAEGIGFSAIKPFSGLWKIFRDLSYMLLVLILIAIGFMIMFRSKINAQTVITIENSLPRIVVAMILITFSFAIAGFMIDIMYVVIGLLVSIIAGRTGVSISDLQNHYMMGTGWTLFEDIAGRSSFGTIGASIGNAFLGIIPLELKYLLKTILGFVTLYLTRDAWIHMLVNPFAGLLDMIHLEAATFGGSFGKLIGGLVTVPVALIVMSTIFIVASNALPLVMIILIMISILFLFFRIFTMLLTTYLKLIILIILAPLLLLFEAVPGRNTFKYWFTNLIGNLIVYPATIAIFLIGYIIINTRYPGADYTARLPYLYGIDSDAFKILIGMGLIFLIPDLVKQLKEMLGVKDLPVNIGVGTFFGGVGAGVGAVMGPIGTFSTLKLAAPGLFKGKLVPKAIQDFIGVTEKTPPQATEDATHPH